MKRSRRKEKMSDIIDDVRRKRKMTNDDFHIDISRIPVFDDISVFGSEEDKRRRKRIIHESDKQIGEVVRCLKIKISRENLFMDDVTREELK